MVPKKELSLIMETIEKIKEQYCFLLEEGYTIAECNCESIVYKQQNSSRVILNFMIDRDKLSLAVSTEYILNNKEYGKYDKYYDFFYIVKMLEPKIAFENIHTDMYSSWLKNNLIKIIELFDQKHEKRTIAHLRKIIKQYNKERWKG